MDVPHVYLRDTKDCSKITIESSLPKDPFEVTVSLPKEPSGITAGVIPVSLIEGDLDEYYKNFGSEITKQLSALAKLKEDSHKRAVESINKEKVAEVVLFLNRRLEQYEQEDSDFCEGMRLAYRVALEKLKQCFEM
ncbi:hypothetical protein XMKAXML_00042 [Enterococcus phage vB_OCPT_PG13]|nr:hypothetical protein XMKAXML_00042 [Enterococcus phage vB_OCPT_PG13]